MRRQDRKQKESEDVTTVEVCVGMFSPPQGLTAETSDEAIPVDGLKKSLRFTSLEKPARGWFLSHS